MVKGIRVSSVLGSILFIIPFPLAALVVVSFGNNTTIQKFLMLVVGTLIMLFILCYVGILLLGNHKELQSEDHIFRMKALEMLGDQNQQFKDLEEDSAKNNPQSPDPKNAITPRPPDHKSLEEHHV